MCMSTAVLRARRIFWTGRDAAAHLTVLDGKHARSGSRARHVVYASGLENAALDGFVVTGGTRAARAPRPAAAASIWMM